jgi:predicted regulator of Ras-like GTPase activity (Roadblock/LC7/MglB family)
MDAAEALEHLLEVSDDVRAVAVFDREGHPVASNLGDDEAAEVAALADAMLAYADTLRSDAAVQTVRGVTEGGDVYIRREGDRAAVAIAAPGSMPGLVEHDLRTLLGSLPRSRRKAKARANA